MSCNIILIRLLLILKLILLIIMLLDLLYPPYKCTYGGYYGLVVVTPRPPPRPPPRLQTFHRSHDNLSDCFHILYVDWYRWEDSWEARWARSDYLWATQAPPPPNSQKCKFLYIVAHIWKTDSYVFPLLYICLLCDEVLLPWNFRSPGFDIRAPNDPPNMKKKVFFSSYFGFKLKHFLSDCFLIWHVHGYGWEDSWKAR